MSSCSKSATSLFIEHSMKVTSPRTSKMGISVMGLFLLSRGWKRCASSAWPPGPPRSNPLTLKKPGWKTLSLVKHSSFCVPVVRDFYFAGPLVDVATQVIGPNVKGATSQLTF